MFERINKSINITGTFNDYIKYKKSKKLTKNQLEANYRYWDVFKDQDGFTFDKIEKKK